ncbi:MAG: AMP-binding protein, partial [Ruminococcus sp.]|nr:AMP-binding protein [Ruminococcus sp.]
AMRGRPEGNKKYSDFLEEVKASCLKAYENQEYPFEELVENVDVNRDMSRNPLFDVMFAMQNNEETNGEVSNVEISESVGENSISKFELEFNVSEFDGRFIIALGYCTDLYKYETAVRIINNLAEVLKNIVPSYERKISDIKMITEDDKNCIINKFNNTFLDYPKNKTVVEMFEEQVTRTPDNIAVIFEEESITYRELNERANVIAHRLRTEGIKPDDFVAIIAERSIEMIIGIFGIIKSGGAYVPIDPSYPEDRIKYMLDDCKPKSILTYIKESELKSDFKETAINLAETDTFIGETSNPEHINRSTDLVYCIYTSGTTGQPKGVILEHRGVVSMKHYLTNLYNVTESDRVLQFANYIFDASVWEMTMSLYNGAALVLVSSQTIVDIEKFEKYVSENKVSITLLPPQYYIQVGNLKTLRILTTGGSAANKDIVRRTVSKYRYINAYGPTENTVLATHWEYVYGTEIPENVPIGKPISNTKIYILSGMDLCGIGVPGELCIAGDGVARGYLNRPELTA